VTLVEPKPSPRPWFAVWRSERGSFGQLPLLARALFVEVLKLTDDNGVIDLAGREPAAAIAWALGADRSDRRALEKYIPMLIADGCLERDGDTLRAPSFARWQPQKKAPKPPKEEHEAVTTEPRCGRDAVAMVSRSHHQKEAKSAEPLNSQKQSRVEESRVEETSSTYVEEEGREGASAPAPSERIRELSVRYPAGLLEEVHQGCALSRKSGRLADSVWLVTLERLAALPADAVLRAMRTFVERHADGDKSESYLVGIARGEAKRVNGAPRQSAFTRPASPAAYAGGDERSDPESFLTEVANG
jgi:hypothetical protein